MPRERTTATSPAHQRTSAPGREAVTAQALRARPSQASQTAESLALALRVPRPGDRKEPQAIQSAGTGYWHAGRAAASAATNRRAASGSESATVRQSQE